MSHSRHFVHFSNNRLLHQWSAKNGTDEAKIEVTESAATEAAPVEETQKLSKFERLQYVGGVKRIEVQRSDSKGAALQSPMGQQALARMSLMKKGS